MPANKNYTLIRLMRGNIEASEGWVPEIGEPLLDMESGTLRYGDGENFGGIPINSCTTIPKETPVNLNEELTWGRFYLDGNVTGLPEGVLSPGKFFLTVISSELGSSVIQQKIEMLDGLYENKSFNRITVDKGITWSDWSEPGGISLNGAGSGVSSDNLNNLNGYIYTSECFIEGMINGPTGTAGCDGFLFTYRKDPNSLFVFQKLIVVGCPVHGGKIFYRYSVTGNVNWNSPGFNWKELTDYVNKDLLNATGILPTINGGTGRNNGSIAQADHANNADLASVSIKLGTTNIGSSSSPFYLKDGVPVACGGTLNVNITGNARTADLALSANSVGGTTTVGSATKPIYMNKGVPTPCNNTLSVNISGNANTASVADIANKTYFSNEGGTLEFSSSNNKMLTTIGIDT